MAEACSFIKDLVPEVVIEKVTVETTGGTSATLTDNPHIDELSTLVPTYSGADRETIIGYISVSAAAGFEEVTNSAGVVVGYRRQHLMTGTVSSTEQVSLTIQFSIKEVISGGTTGTIASWFGQEDFTKYFKVSTIAMAYDSQDVFSFNTGESISMGQVIAWKESGAEALYVTQGTGVMQEELNRIAETFSGGATDPQFVSGEEDFRTWYNTGGSRGAYVSETIGVQDEINNKTSSTTAPTLQDLYNWGFTSVDTDGSTIFKVPFEVTLQLPVSPEIENISVMIYPQIDMNQLEEDYQIDLDGDSSIGRSGSAPQLDAYVSYNTYVISGSRTSGKAFSQTGSVKETMPSVAISDQRNYADIATLPSMAAELIKVSPGTATPTQKIEYFSDVYLSEDELGRVKGVFMLDYESILLDNAQFGGFFNSTDGTSARALKRLSSRWSDPAGGSDHIATLLNECPIIELSLYRERVDTTFSYQDVYEKEMIASIEAFPAPRDDTEASPHKDLLPNSEYRPDGNMDAGPIGQIRERMVSFADSDTRTYISSSYLKKITKSMMKVDSKFTLVK